MVNDNALTLGPPHPGSVDPHHFTAGDRVVFGSSSVFHADDSRESFVQTAARLAAAGHRIWGA